MKTGSGNIAPTVEHTPEERGVIGSNPIVPIPLQEEHKLVDASRHFRVKVGG